MIRHQVISSCVWQLSILLEYMPHHVNLQQNDAIYSNSKIMLFKPC